MSEDSDDAPEEEAVHRIASGFVMVHATSTPESSMGDGLGTRPASPRVASGVLDSDGEDDDVKDLSTMRHKHSVQWASLGRWKQDEEDEADMAEEAADKIAALEDHLNLALAQREEMDRQLDRAHTTIGELKESNRLMKAALEDARQELSAAQQEPPKSWPQGEAHWKQQVVDMSKSHATELEDATAKFENSTAALRASLSKSQRECKGYQEQCLLLQEEIARLTCAGREKDLQLQELSNHFDELRCLLDAERRQQAELRQELEAMEGSKSIGKELCLSDWAALDASGLGGELHGGGEVWRERAAHLRSLLGQARKQVRLAAGSVASVGGARTVVMEVPASPAAPRATSRQEPQKVCARRLSTGTASDSCTTAGSSSPDRSSTTSGDDWHDEDDTVSTASGSVGVPSLARAQVARSKEASAKVETRECGMALMMTRPVRAA